MSYRIGDVISRVYKNFRGIDLLNPKNSVDIRRSPDCLNVWKSYSTEQSNMIETREGYTLLANLGSGKINGMYMYSASKCLVHIGTNLLLWSNFPSNPATTTNLKNTMLNKKSIMFPYNDKLYILDGMNYLVYDGINLADVSSNAYVPTTSISRSPNGRRRRKR